MATSPAILMTMIKLSAPKDLSKPTTGFSPVDADAQAAVNRYKNVQELSRREPAIQEVLNGVRRFANIPTRDIPNEPMPRQNPSPEYLVAAGGTNRQRPVDFFEDLGQFTGFLPSGASVPNSTLREGVERYPMFSALGMADSALGSLSEGVGRERLNRRLAAESDLMNSYINALGATGSSAPRVFFDRKNQLRNF